MQCQEVQELLSAYLDGMLDPSERDRADEHLQGCPACRSELDDLKMVVGLVRDLPLVEPPAEFRRGLRYKLEQVPGPRGRGGLLAALGRGKWSGIVAAAASFLLVIGLATNWYGLPWQFGTADQTGRVEDIALKAGAGKAPPENPGPETREDRVFPEGLKGQGTSGTPVALTFSGSRSVPAEQPERMKDQDASVPAAPPGETAAPAEETGSVQGRKLAASNGASGVPARGTAAVPPADEPDQPRQAAIEVKVPDRAGAVREVFTIAQKLGGMAAVLPGTDGRELILRVPTSQFEKALTDIGKTGEVVRQDYPPEETADLLMSTARITGISPEALKLEELGKGGGDPGENPPPGTVVPPAGDPAKPAGSGPEMKKEHPSGTAGGTSMSTIKVRLE